MARRNLRTPASVTLPPIRVFIPITICSPQYSSAFVDHRVLTVLSVDSLNGLLGIFRLSNCSVDLVFLLSKCLLTGGVGMVCAFPSRVLELLPGTTSSQVRPLLLEEGEELAVVPATGLK